MHALETMTYSSNWNEVEKLFLNKSLDRGGKVGTIIFPKQIALDFVEACRERKIPILGLDGFLTGKDIKPIKGFTITENSVQPIQDYSIDFSGAPYKYSLYNLDEIYDKSATLIKESPDYVHFEIVCGKE